MHRQSRYRHVRIPRARPLVTVIKKDWFCSLLWWREAENGGSAQRRRWWYAESIQVSPAHHISSRSSTETHPAGIFCCTGAHRNERGPSHLVFPRQLCSTRMAMTYSYMYVYIYICGRPRTLHISCKNKRILQLQLQQALREEFRVKAKKFPAILHRAPAQLHPALTVSSIG